MAGLDNRVPTSNPLCLGTSGVGGFDSLALPPDYLGTKSPDFSQQETPDCNGRGLCFGSNGHELVTNFFEPNLRRNILVSGILDLLIKSQPFFVHRRVQQSTAGTILRLNAKTVPTGQK